MTNELTEEEAMKFFSDFYYGKHHIPGYTLKRYGSGWCVHHDRGDLATFDFSGLTRLVIMGHDRCIRVSIEAIRNSIMRITIWKREREGGISEEHPTMEQAIKTIRSK